MIKQMLKIQVDKLPLHNNLNQAIPIKRRIALHEKSKELLKPTVMEIIRENRRTEEFQFPFRGPLSIHVEFVLEDHKGNDWDNLITSFKPWQDLMVQVGFLNDDSQINEAHVLLARYKSGPSTIITLVEKGT